MESADSDHRYRIRDKERNNIKHRLYYKLILLRITAPIVYWVYEPPYFRDSIVGVLAPIRPPIVFWGNSFRISAR